LGHGCTFQYNAGGRGKALSHWAAVFRGFFSALAKARSYICVEYYIIRADRTGNRLSEELAAACRRGVQVFLIYDYIGCIDTPETYFRELRRQGVRCLAFNPPPSGVASGGLIAEIIAN